MAKRDELLGKSSDHRLDTITKYSTIRNRIARLEISLQSNGPKQPLKERVQEQLQNNAA